MRKGLSLGEGVALGKFPSLRGVQLALHVLMQQEQESRGQLTQSFRANSIHEQSSSPTLKQEISLRSSKNGLFSVRSLAVAKSIA